MSPALPRENGERQIETSQGSMMVSSDLLIGSRAVADASFATVSDPNAEVNSSASPEAHLSSSTLSSPNVRDGVVSAQTESQFMGHPEPNGVKYDAPSPYKDGKNWAIDPQL
ncbi:hypothetical protein J3459_014750, partial [Metarhizium acridum]